MLAAIRHPLSLHRRRVRREVADIEHRPPAALSRQAGREQSRWHGDADDFHALLLEGHSICGSSESYSTYAL